MNYLKPTISILSIIILAIIIIQLTTPPSRQLAPLLENTATTSLMAVNTITVTATITPTATTTPSLTPTPTDTMPPYTPAPTLDRRGSGGRINRGTPTPPTATPTPTHTPIPAVRVVSDEPLFSSKTQILTDMLDGKGCWPVEWIDENTVIVQSSYSSNMQYWRVSFNNNTVEPTTWEYPKSSPEAIAEMKQYDPRVDYVHVSPNGQWGAWSFYSVALLLKELGTNKPPINLIENMEGYELGGSVNQTAWSPHSNLLAYIIENHKDYRKELRINDVFGNLLVVIPLRIIDINVNKLVWSPDGRYLAFEMQEQPQSEIINLYLVRIDGTGMTQLTQHGNVDGGIIWHPNGKAISYNYRHEICPRLITISDW